MPTSVYGQDVVSFIEEYIDLIEQDTEESWTQVYFYASQYFTPRSISRVSQLLLDAGIDPVSAMKFVPDNFLRSTNIYSYTIPTTCKRIGNKAFAHTNLKTVTIPGSVSEIEESAFFDCVYLESCTIEPGSLAFLPDMMFDYCSHLKRLQIPKTLKEFNSDCLGGSLSGAQGLVVQYDGTQEEFKNILRAGLGNNEFVVSCTDGSFNVKTQDIFWGTTDD